MYRVGHYFSPPGHLKLEMPAVKHEQTLKIYLLNLSYAKNHDSLVFFVHVCPKQYNLRKTHVIAQKYLRNHRLKSLTQTNCIF